MCTGGRLPAASPLLLGLGRAPTHRGPLPSVVGLLSVQGSDTPGTGEQFCEGAKWARPQLPVWISRPRRPLSGPGARRTQDPQRESVIPRAVVMAVTSDFNVS